MPRPFLARLAASALASLAVATSAQAADLDLPPGGGFFQQVAANVPAFGNVWTGLGQSFVASASQLRFGFYMLDTDGLADTLVFRLLGGDGLAGPVLAQRSVTFDAGLPFRRGLLEADFSSLNLTVGNPYTVMASTPGQGLPALGSSTSIGIEYAQIGNLPGLYPQGRFYFAGSNYDLASPAFAGRDLAFRVTAVPEPGTLAMTGLGLAALGLWRRRRAA